MYMDITGIILSGGKSKRMGLNKSLLKIGDITIIERVTDIMESVFAEVILIANEPDIYDFLDLPIYSDIFENKGPLGGIHSGLVNSKTNKNFIISCDIPLINEGLIKSIINFPTNKPITVPKADGFIQQLCGLYSKAVIQEVENILKESDNEEVRNAEQKNRKCKVHHLIDTVPAEIITEVETLNGYIPRIFHNMNTPEDFEYIKQRLS